MITARTFFVSSPKSFKKEYKISKDGRSCDSYSTAYFSAYTTPSAEYPMPLYIYSNKYHTILKETENYDGIFLGYFYVSRTWRANSSAIYYAVDEDEKGEYISEFASSSTQEKCTKNTVYVKNFEVYEGIKKSFSPTCEDFFYMSAEIAQKNI